MCECPTGQWDWGTLADSFDFDDLVEWGFSDIGEVADALSLTEIGDESSGISDRDLGEKLDILPIDKSRGF